MPPQTPQSTVRSGLPKVKVTISTVLHIPTAKRHHAYIYSPRQLWDWPGDGRDRILQHSLDWLAELFSHTMNTFSTLSTGRCMAPRVFPFWSQRKKRGISRNMYGVETVRSNVRKGGGKSKSSGSFSHPEISEVVCRRGQSLIVRKSSQIFPSPSLGAPERKSTPYVVMCPTSLLIPLSPFSSLSLPLPFLPLPFSLRFFFSFLPSLGPRLIWLPFPTELQWRC